MYRHVRLRQVTRRRIAWLVAAMLLWQQVAVAAYACAVTPDAGRTAVAAISHGMGMGSVSKDAAHCSEMHGAPAPPLCQKHCLPDHLTPVDSHAVSVPFLALPASLPETREAALAEGGFDGRSDSVDRRRPSPSPLHLYCSLLI
jgi:hypothetical protein